jgi:hypothetical protein
MRDGLAYFAREDAENLMMNVKNVYECEEMAWPACSPDLNPLYFFLWGFVYIGYRLT